MQVVLPGSSQFLMQHGLSESLAGRWELIRVPHGSFAEMRDAFGWDVERYVYFGGYPGAAPLVEDKFRWKSHVLDAIIEPTGWLAEQSRASRYGRANASRSSRSMVSFQR